MKHFLMEVKWKDAARTASVWVTDVNIQLVDAVTVGYLIKRTRKVIIVAQTKTPDESLWGGIWIIPAAWVTKIRRIKG